MAGSIQENIEEFFSLSAEELERRLDKLEYGNQSLFTPWQSEEYPRFVEKVIFQPKKCNVQFPPIGPKAFSRGVRSTFSLPDIRNSESIELLSNAEESTVSMIALIDEKTKRSKPRVKPRLGSPCLLLKHTPSEIDKKLLVCQGKGFPKSSNSKGFGLTPKSAVDSVQAENSSKTERGLPLIQGTKSHTTQVGPWFRAWSSQKRERICDSETNSKEVNCHFATTEQKAIRSFDLYGLLKDVQRHKEPRTQSMEEIAIKTAANYVSKAKQELNLSTKGGGFVNRTKHVSVREEIMIKKKLRQKLFSFYNFGGSSNEFERIVSDVCSNRNPSLKFKNFPAYPDNIEKGIFPLAAPHSNLPLLPNSPMQLQKLCNLLDTFPWFAWQPHEPLNSVVVRGSKHSKQDPAELPNSEMSMAMSDNDFEMENPKLEVRLPTCV